MSKDEFVRERRHFGALSRFSRLNGLMALLAAAVLGVADVAALSRVGSTTDVAQWTAPLRLAVLLTIGMVALTVGGLVSLVRGVTRDAEPQAQEEEKEPEAIGAEELDIFNVRSKAA